MTALIDMPAVLTVEEAAGLLRIGRSAAYQAVKAGDIPSITVGRSIRVPRHQLERLLGLAHKVEEPAGQAGSSSTPPEATTDELNKS